MGVGLESIGTVPSGYFQPNGFELVIDNRLTRFDLKAAANIWAYFYISPLFDLPHGVPPDLCLFGNFSHYSPRAVSLELTDACNASCVFCYRNSSPSKKRYLSNWKDCLELLALNGVQVIELTGGEPTHHPEFRDIGEACANLFTKVRLLSNGFNLSSISRTLEYCCQHTDFAVQIDLDSTNAFLHDYIKRLPGAHCSVIKAASVMKEMGIPFRVAMNVLDINLSEVNNVCSLSSDIGASRFSPSPIIPIGRAVDGTNLSKSNFPEFREVLLTLKHVWGDFIGSVKEDIPYDIWQSPKHCGASRLTVAVDPDGNIRPCVMASDEFNFGNLFTDGWEESLTRPIAKKLSEISPPSTECCSECHHLEFCWGCLVRPWHTKQDNCAFCAQLSIGNRPP